MAPVVTNCTGRVRNFHTEQAWSLVLHLLQVDSHRVVRFVLILPETQNWKHQCLCRTPPWSGLPCWFWGRSASAKSLPGSPPWSESWVVVEEMHRVLGGGTICHKHRPFQGFLSEIARDRRQLCLGFLDSRQHGGGRRRLVGDRRTIDVHEDLQGERKSSGKISNSKPDIPLLHCSTSCLCGTHTSPEMILDCIIMWVAQLVANSITTSTWILLLLCDTLSLWQRGA